MFWMSNLLPLPVSRSVRPLSNGRYGFTRQCLPGSFVHQSKLRSKPPLRRRALNVSRVGSVGVSQRMLRAAPEYNAVACLTLDRTLSPTMPNDERQVSRESIPGSVFVGY